MIKNWDLRRILYLVGGIVFIVIAVKDQTFWLAIFGIYFAAMAILRFGCAAGHCDVELNSESENPDNKKLKICHRNFRN